MLLANTSDDKAHKNKSLIVVPMILIEVATSFYLFIKNDFALLESLSILSLIAILLITFFISIPCHNRLCIGKDLETIDRLIKSNWIRTLLWSLRGFFALSCLI